MFIGDKSVASPQSVTLSDILCNGWAGNLFLKLVPAEESMEEGYSLARSYLATVVMCRLSVCRPLGTPLEMKGGWVIFTL